VHIKFEVQLYASLSLVVRGVEFSALLSGRFSTWQRDHDNHFCGNWMGFRVGMDNVKSDSLLLLGIDKIYQPSSPEPSPWHYSVSKIRTMTS
jgi:hypothetical protein